MMNVSSPTKKWKKEPAQVCTEYWTVMFSQQSWKWLNVTFQIFFLASR